MHYNLKPIIKAIDTRIPNDEVWKERITNFFNNEKLDADIQDYYYDSLVSDVDHMRNILSSGVLIDEYTGLFSFATQETDSKHTFNFAYYIHRYYHQFMDSPILTFVDDYGIVNNQIKLCGLHLVNSIMNQKNVVGSILTCIGNNCNPYLINVKHFPKYQTIIASCIFDDDDKSYQNWNFLLDEHAKGKTVYLSSNTFFHLKKYINYDKIKILETPNTVYDKESYSDLRYGFHNRLYKII
jgi:hypothetical protein